MEEKKTDMQSLDIKDSVSRREFCRKAIKRSSVVLAAAAAGAAAYKRPSIRSFFGTNDAYAQTTPPGKFSLKGDNN